MKIHQKTRLIGKGSVGMEEFHLRKVHILIADLRLLLKIVRV